MKSSNLMPSLVQLDKNEMQQLAEAVKETIASDADFSKSEKNILKAVDIWKIERNKKSATRTFANKRNYIPFI
ncbi:MAG: hypothetical protein JST47_14175 [Bacteroidetes bacterium]|nr:hypothetical protein [Bacteroidota bacterium]MBS1973896.1 hypothetical protein [Bacteroidota bacterium]